MTLFLGSRLFGRRLLGRGFLRRSLLRRRLLLALRRPLRRARVDQRDRLFERQRRRIARLGQRRIGGAVGDIRPETRQEERSGGKECVRKVRSRGWTI